MPDPILGDPRDYDDGPVFDGSRDHAGQPEHTPGPWEVDRDPDVIACYGSDSKWTPLSICGPDNRDRAEPGLTLALVVADEVEEHAANARLIAAAPEMFEALRGLLRFHPDCLDDSKVAALGYVHDDGQSEGARWIGEAEEAAREALAKALGRHVDANGQPIEPTKTPSPSNEEN